MEPASQSIPILMCPIYRHLFKRRARLHGLYYYADQTLRSLAVGVDIQSITQLSNPKSLRLIFYHDLERRGR